MSEFYVKGTIKIKNVNGTLVPFLPETNVACVASDSGTSLSSVIGNIEIKLAKAKSSGGVEIVHTEPNETTTKDYGKETLIAWYKNPELDGAKHLTVTVFNDIEKDVLKVGDVVHFTYVATNDGGE